MDRVRVTAELRCRLDIVKLLLAHETSGSVQESEVGAAGLQMQAVQVLSR